MVRGPAFVGTNLGRGLAVAAGVSFAAFPTVGPLIALLAVSTGRIEVQRADRWWWAAGLLLAAPFLATGSPRAAALILGQVLAVWLLFRAAVEVRKVTHRTTFALDVGVGLVLGLAITLGFGLSRIDGFAWRTSFTALDAIVWRANPAVFGHSMFALSSLLAVVVPSPRLRVVSLALGAVGILASGSREAMFAWLVVAIGLTFLRRRGSRRVRALHWSLVAVMVFFVSGLGAFVGLGRTGFLTSLVGEPAGANLFRGTEIPAADWWHALGVEHTASTVIVQGERRTGFVLTKTDDEPWSRLQQGVVLQPDTTYTLSAAWSAHEALRPGLDGWGVDAPDGPAMVISATRSADGLGVTASGPMRVLDRSLVDIDSGWQRASVTFRYEGERPLVWYAGVVVDRTTRTGERLTFAELQLTESDTMLSYRPGVAERGVTDLRASRLPIWRDAFAAFVAKPWFGWGEGGLPEAVATLHSDDRQLRPIASHAHNMVLDVLVKQGVVGGFGLVLLFGLVALRTVQRRDRAAALVLLGVAIVNTFDATLLSGEIVYPLAAILGWRAVGRREAAEAETGVGSAALTRLGLATADLVSAGLSFLVAAVLLRWGAPEGIAYADPRVLAYATAAWPLANLAFGQYPGYGRSSSEELRFGFLANVVAGTALLAIRSAFGATFPVPWQWICLATVVLVPLAPIVRWLAKRALAVLRVWGRPVLVVGSGGSADDLVASLLREPHLGLRPVLLVDDGADLAREGPSVVPRTNTLPMSAATLARHVVVVPGDRPSRAVERVLGATGRHTFRIVQVVPRLGSIPSSDVAARPLGRVLSLEVRNNLASPWNRAVKRAFDLVAVLVGGILAFPLMAAIALAIRLDSPGRAYFSQERVGRDGKPFRVWKFRTMVADAEDRLRVLLESNPDARAEWEATQKLVDDPRITRVGRILRETSLDELPQLWNVVRGEMSLVGPRPIVTAEIGKYADRFEYYMQVRPGMTGYWQVSGRSDTSYGYRVDLDTYYVRNWSIWLDLDILVRTVGVVLRRKGAY